MTDPTTGNYGRENAPKEKLGVLSILSESFSILFRNILLLGGIMFLVLLLSMLPYIVIYGSFGEYLRTASRGFGGMSVTTIAINFILTVVIYGGLISVLSQLAYDLRAGTRGRIMGYITKAPGHMLPITLFAIVGGFLAIVPFSLATGATGVAPIAGIALIPLGIAGSLYVLAMFSVTNPSIAIEGAGFRGLGQSYSRTKGYRWSIIGVLALFFLILAVIMGGFGVVFSFASSNFLQEIGTGQFTTAMVAFQIVNMVFSAAITPLICIIPVVIFARLKEIKEGHGFGDVGAVFE